LIGGVYLGKLPRWAKVAELCDLASCAMTGARILSQCSDTTWRPTTAGPIQFALYDDGKNQWYWGQAWT
jgi:hypothetical protein